jgi:hypothetical protein
VNRRSLPGGMEGGEVSRRPLGARAEGGQELPGIPAVRHLARVAACTEISDAPMASGKRERVRGPRPR